MMFVQALLLPFSIYPSCNTVPASAKLFCPKYVHHFSSGRFSDCLRMVTLVFRVNINTISESDAYFGMMTS